MSQRRRREDAVSDEEDRVVPGIDTAVQACVRLVVAREGSKIPLKRAEIAKHLASVCELPTSRVGVVLSSANQLLKKVYGYKLVQVDAKGGTQYVVVLSEDGPPNQPVSPIASPLHRRLLTAALTHIFMSGGSVKEEDMWKFLSKAGLLEENDHSGRKILTHTLTKQMYLSYLKEGEGEYARNVFKWGQRASEETSKMFVLEKVAEAMGKTPEHWSEQNRLAATEPTDAGVSAQQNIID